MAEREAVLVSPTDGESTQQPYISYQDFLKDYEGQRAEWIMGQVEILGMNNIQHQEIIGFLYKLLSFYLGLRKLGKVFLAGVSMYVGDQLPAREPDVIVVLNAHLDRIKPTFLDGPGDVVFEVVSPESVARDYGDKFQEYEAAGVGEYWLIDPIRKNVRLSVLGDDKLFHSVELNSAGELVSAIMPGFAINPEMFWSDAFPDGAELIELAQAMANR